MTAPSPDDDQSVRIRDGAPGDGAPGDGDVAGRAARQLTALAAVASALASLPPDADDATLMLAVGDAMIPALADLCHLHVADSTGQLALVAVMPHESDGATRLLAALDAEAIAMLVYEPLVDGARPVLVVATDTNVAGGDDPDDTETTVDTAAHRALLDAAGLGWELALPLGGGRSSASAPDALLVVDGAGGRAVPAEPLALALGGLVGGWRAARVAQGRAASLQARLEETAIAGRELAHSLNNSLTLPVGLIELLLDRGALSAEMQEMIRAAASDLQTLERHIRTFQEQMRAHSSGRAAPGRTLPPP